MDSENMRTLDEALDGYEIVNVQNDYVVARKLAEDDEQRPEPGKQLSAGMGGQTRYAELSMRDYNPDFVGEQGIVRYREMRNDGQIRNSLRKAKSPVLGARWFIKPKSNEDEDQRIAQFIWDNLNIWMSTTWIQNLIESLYMLDYGYYVFEKVFDIVPDPYGEGPEKVIWKKMVPIHPLDIEEFMYDEDDGGPAGVKLQDEDETEIPIEKLLIFTFDKEAGNLEGHSVLRSAAKHWFIKENLYKIDAIQKERHGVGVPIIKLPPGAGTKEENVAHSIGRNLRANESAHVVTPYNWEIEFAKLEGQRVDSLESAAHHGEMIYENVMGKPDDKDMFMKSARFTAEIIKEVWNKYAIPQLCKWNWDLEMGHFPELDLRRLGDETDWRQMSFTLRNFIGADIITPTDKDEAWVREEMDMPDFDPDSARDVQNPQVPGSSSPSARVGPARQAPVRNRRGGTGNTGRVDRDVSGQ